MDTKVITPSSTDKAMKFIEDIAKNEGLLKGIADANEASQRQIQAQPVVQRFNIPAR